jgi:hypothetical protein
LVNPESIIRYGGIYLLLFVVFAETGLFIGFFNFIKKKLGKRFAREE